MWKEIDIFDTMDIEHALQIIDDALVFGFEIKVENHKMYYLETLYPLPIC